MDNCSHALVFGSLYTLPAYHGSCDGCGAPHHFPIVGQYVGDVDNKHLFNIPPYSCMGCHGTVVSVNMICGGIDVSKKYKKVWLHG